MEDESDPLTRRIIGCAIEVHRRLGPGLPERVNRAALAIEFGHQNIAFERERPIDVTYRGVKLGAFYPDFIVENEVIVEVKSTLNFGRPVLREGLKRFVLRASEPLWLDSSVSHERMAPLRRS